MVELEAILRPGYTGECHFFLYRERYFTGKQDFSELLITEDNMQLFFDFFIAGCYFVLSKKHRLGGG